MCKSFRDQENAKEKREKTCLAWNGRECTCNCPTMDVNMVRVVQLPSHQQSHSDQAVCCLTVFHCHPV